MTEPGPLAVLVADDNPAARAQAVRLLREAGFAVLEAAEAEALFRLAAAGDADVVLLDAELSGRRPAELAAGLAGTPAVAVVGAGADGLAAEARAAGLGGPLARPLGRPQVLAELDRLLLGEADGAAPVDLAHLDQYTLADAAFERDLLREFVPNAGGYVRGLAAAGSEAGWRGLGHTLKGASRGLGAGTLARLAEAAEPAFAEGSAARRRRVRSMALALGRVADWSRVRHPGPA